MYYHVRITPKPDRWPIEKLDLSKQQLQLQFLSPYENGEPIAVGGRIIKPDDLEEIRITRTKYDSSKLRQIVKAEQAANPVKTYLSEDWHIADKGEDVTDKLIQGPPGYKRRPVKASKDQTAIDLIDFAIITAVEVERLAVCKAFGLTAQHRVRKGSRVYWRGRLHLKSREFYDLVVAQSSDMANVDAAIVVNDTIHYWNPGAMLLVGIAAAGRDGSDEDDEMLGDLILGSHVYYYERGKEADANKKPEPYMYPADTTLWNNVRSVPPWKTRIPVSRPDGTKNRPRILEGVIASGEKVIAEKAVRDEIASGHRKIRAIEMEGYGFSKAVFLGFDQCRYLVMKAICDRGDRNKKDNWQPYAAAVASGFAKHFLLDRPLEPRSRIMEQSTSYQTGKPSQELVNRDKREPDPKSPNLIVGQIHKYFDQAREVANAVSQEVTPKKARRLAEASVLWVDDNPSNNFYLRQAFVRRRSPTALLIRPPVSNSPC